MLSKIRSIIAMHLSNNMNTYTLLFITFIIGVTAGAFTVNGLSAMQRDDLVNYLQGFLQLLDNQNVDSSELLKIVLVENLKLIAILWVLGVSIIGIPLIVILVGIRGFITGFSSGFIIHAIGFKGVLLTLFGLMPKEILIVPCIIALGVNGINFSLKIIKKRPEKSGLKDGLKNSLVSYCFVTAFFSGFIFLGALLEAYVSPVLIRMIVPAITG